MSISSNSSSYKANEDENSITGTGFLLKDVAYRSKCIELSCLTGCCKGSLSNMKCGSQEFCDDLLYDVKLSKIIYMGFSIIGISILIIIFIGLLLRKNNPYLSLILNRMALSILAIVTFPLSIFICLIVSKSYKEEEERRKGIKIYKCEPEIDPEEFIIDLEKENPNESADSVCTKHLETDKNLGSNKIYKLHAMRLNSLNCL
jgi:hypothetical protein